MPSHADWAAKNIGKILGDEMLACLASPLVWAGAAGDEVADPAQIDPTSTVVDCLTEAEEALDLDMLKQNLGGLLGGLSDRSRKVVELRFGLANGVQHSLAEVAAQLGLSRERVRQIEGKALRQLRIRQRFGGLRDFR